MVIFKSKEWNRVKLGKGRARVQKEERNRTRTRKEKLGRRRLN